MVALSSFAAWPAAAPTLWDFVNPELTFAVNYLPEASLYPIAVGTERNFKLTFRDGTSYECLGEITQLHRTEGLEGDEVELTLKVLR